MRRSNPIVGACLGAAVLLLVACGGGAGGGSGTSAEVAQGHELFRSTCATCHGPEAEGMPRLGKNLHDNAFVQGQGDEELVQFLKQGRPASHPDNERGVDMPPKGGNPALSDEDLAKIVAYMRSIS
jgi:disulfide bond formation protein DsbB